MGHEDIVIPHTEVSDVTRLEAFVGKNSDKFLRKWGITHQEDYNSEEGKVVKHSMNWYAFLFGVFYLGYRKIYLEVAIYILVTTTISAILGQFVENTIYFDLVSWIIVGILFNTYYLDKANKQIKKVKQLGLTTDEELILLAKQGGTSKLGILIAFGLLILSALVLVALGV